MILYVAVRRLRGLAGSIAVRPAGSSGWRRRLARSAGAALAVLALASGPALAQANAADDDQQAHLPDLPLESLLNMKVYAASKFEQEAGQAPASVSIVTAEEIRTHGYRTLGDVLRSVRGFYVSYDRNYTYVGVRGFERPGDYNGRILLLVNGHQMNDTIFEEALLGTESPIDLGLVDRVEVVRGPSSSLYGTSAFFAIVNLIMRAGHAMNGVEVDAQAGSLVSRSLRASAGGKSSGGWEGLVSASAFAARGNQSLYYPAFDAPETNNGLAENADGDRSDSVFASASGHGFDLQGAFGSRTKTVPTAAFGTVFDDPRTQTRDARGFVDLQYTRPLSARTTLKGRASYDQYDYDGTYAYDTGLFHDGAHGAWLTGGGDLVHRIDRHTVTAGFEVRDNLRQNQFAADETGTLLDDRRGSSTAAIFAQDEFRLHPRVLVNAGLRLDDYFDTFGATLNPRLGVIVSPTDSSSLKLLYGRAFRAPNPFELYYEQDAVSAALQPETITTQEVVWEQRVTPRFQVTGSVFHNHVRNLINQQSGSPTSLDGLYFTNSESVGATGVEVELQTDLPGRVHMRVADAFQSATDDDTGARISNAPRQVGFVVLDAPLGRTGLVAGLNAWFIGERQTVNDARVAGSVVTDLTVSRPAAGGRIALAISVHNLFDVAYSDPGSEEHRQPVIPQDGRTFGVRATWRLR
ncbi:MAG TPA: TonB-dependent receptor [Vicinamibacterales bacterium]|jgi:outer membrane receptor for ferrienterochelin and colicins|nr:TonB-dependent receptor [Vicinamibacterales bacterium]